MCVTAAIAATAAVVGTATSVASAQANAAQQKLALEMERQQMNEQREVARLQAAEAEAARVREYEAQRASNLAALAASGTRSESFLQGIDKASREALALDLANIRTGFLQEDVAAMRGIRVNRMSRRAVGISSTLQQIGAVAQGGAQLYNINQSLKQTGTS